MRQENLHRQEQKEINLDAARGASFLAEPEILLDAILTESMQTHLECLTLALSRYVCMCTGPQGIPAASGMPIHRRGGVPVHAREDMCLCTVWGGGAGKVSRCVLPFRAQRWHFWCHVLCRYVAFVVTTFPAGTVAFCAVDANVSSHNLLEAISHTHPRRV